MHSGKLSGRTTYQDLLMFCFGKAGLIMISLFQFIFAFGGKARGSVCPADHGFPIVVQCSLPTFDIDFSQTQPCVHIPLLLVTPYRMSCKH